MKTIVGTGGGKPATKGTCGDMLEAMKRKEKEKKEEKQRFLKESQVARRKELDEMEADKLRFIQEKKQKQ